MLREFCFRIGGTIYPRHHLNLYPITHITAEGICPLLFDFILFFSVAEKLAHTESAKEKRRGETWQICAQILREYCKDRHSRKSDKACKNFDICPKTSFFAAFFFFLLIAFAGGEKHTVCGEVGFIVKYYKTAGLPVKLDFFVNTAEKLSVYRGDEFVALIDKIFISVLLAGDLLAIEQECVIFSHRLLRLRVL